MNGYKNVENYSKIDGYTEFEPSMVGKDERTIFIGNARSIVKVLRWGEQNGFRKLDFSMDNFSNKHGFLTAMIFRSDIPDDLAMRIKFDRIQYLLYKRISDVIYGFIYIDDKDYLNYSIAYKKEGKWKFKILNGKRFVKMLKAYEQFIKFGMEVRE